MRLLPAFSLLALFLCVSLGTADLLRPRKLDVKEPVAALSVRPYIGLFKALERASVQASGSGESNLSLYIFDAQGNCVAMDDVTRPEYCDEVRAEWIADAVGRYNLEIRNAGLNKNSFALVIR